MAIIYKEKKERNENEGKKAWTGVLSAVPVRLFGADKYALIALDEDAKAVLEGAPIDVTVQDDKAIFNCSKFARCALGNDEVDIFTQSVKGVANVKLRHADFDYKYKGKTGHSSKLEISGIRFIVWEPAADVLKELDFGTEGVDVSDVNLDDLPF